MYTSYTAGLENGSLYTISKSADISALPVATQFIPESCCQARREALLLLSLLLLSRYELSHFPFDYTN